jgi:hypothetical protein
MAVQAGSALATPLLPRRPPALPPGGIASAATKVGTIRTSTTDVVVERVKNRETTHFLELPAVVETSAIRQGWICGLLIEERIIAIGSILLLELLYCASQTSRVLVPALKGVRLEPICRTLEKITKLHRRKELVI